MVNILIVEDDKGFARLVRRALNAAPGQLEVEVAGSMTEARRLLERMSPDLIIADIMMPDGRGTDLLTSDQNDQLPIVLMTGFGDEAMAVEAIKAGALDYIIKSKEAIDNLPHIVERAMRQWQHITERKKAEDAVGLSEEKFSKAFQASPNSMTITSLDGGRFVDVNEGFEQISGYSRDEVLGKTSMDIRLWEYPGNRDDMLKVLKNEGSIRDMEVRIRSKTGVIHHCLMSCEIIEIKAKQYMLAITKDITERLQMEQRERAHLDELAHVSRLSTVGQMASGLAHELNQPLCSIMMYAEGSLRLAREQNGVSPDLLEQLEIVTKQAERAGEIINRIKSFSRKEAPRRRVVCVNDIIHETIALMGAQMRRAKIDINLDLEEDIASVWVDHVQIQQVIVNLIQNAIDAMDETESGKRRLTLTSRATETGTIEVSVRDNGKGLAGDKLDRVFESFFTTRPDGLGLGLSICRSIIEAHKGNLFVKENQDRGLTFCFALPTGQEKQ